MSDEVAWMAAQVIDDAEQRWRLKFALQDITPVTILSDGSPYR